MLRPVAVLLAGLVIALALLQALLFREPGAAPAPSAAPAPLTAETFSRAYQLINAGRAEEAARLLQPAPPQSSCDQVKAMLHLEQMAGRPREAARLAREHLRSHPQDTHVASLLAQALLFALAAEGATPAASLAEVRELIGGLTPAADPIFPGALSALHAQLAFLEHRWAEAEREAGAAIRLGVPEGEAWDLLIMRMDLMLRAGRDAEARAVLSTLQRRLDRFQEPVFYQLYPLREGALLMRLHFGERITRADVAACEASRRHFLAQGIRPTLDLDLAPYLSRCADSQRRGDLPGQRQAFRDLLEALRRPHAPTCFYGEAVHFRLAQAVSLLFVGDLLAREGDVAGAKALYEEAARFRPGDRAAARRLRLLHGRKAHTPPG